MWESREAGNHLPSPNHPGTIAAEVVGPSSISICGLAIFHLYTQCVRNYSNLDLHIESVFYKLCNPGQGIALRALILSHVRLK